MRSVKSSNPYEILGVTLKTPPDGIKKAYLKLAQLYHPDKGGDPEDFKALVDAYKKLCLGSHSSYTSDPGFEPQQPNDENFIVAHISVTISDIKKGVAIPVSYIRSYKCSACANKDFDSRQQCRVCRGTGYFKRTENIKVRLREDF